MANTFAISDSITSVLPEAALVVCTQTDEICEINENACKLLGVTADAPPRFASFLGTQLGEFLVFADEVDTRGQAWTRRIDLQRADQGALRCEIRGHKLVSRPHHILLLFGKIQSTPHWYIGVA